MAYLEQIEGRYGNDAELVSGKKYFYPYGRSLGHPFLVEESEAADLCIRGREFPLQKIKYDIYNQLLVLEYTDVSGSIGNLVLGMEWVESFRTATRTFIRTGGPGGEPVYLQQIATGNYECLYHWTKLYQLDMSTGSQRYAFSDPRRTAYLRIGEVFHLYRNNRGFTRAFPKHLRKQVKGILRQDRLKVQKASDFRMSALMQQLNSILDEAD